MAKSSIEMPLLRPSSSENTSQNAGITRGITDEFSLGLALGTLTLVLAIGLLYILNRLIFLYYNPDVTHLINKISRLSFRPISDFMPEPVERMQFLFTLIAMPLFVFISYLTAKTLRSDLREKPWLNFLVSTAGIALLIAWLIVILSRGSSFDFIKGDLFGQLGLTAGIIIYSTVAFLFLVFNKMEERKKVKLIIQLVSYGIVIWALLNIFFYNRYHASELTPWFLEVNAVLYPVTQVLSGKSLLVDINAQYGLYAWFLAPFFRCIGLNPGTFSLTLGAMNVLSFLFIYLALGKMIRQKLLRLITFLAVVYWQYWFSKIPFDEISRPYFQYWPIRIFFPALAFYLIALYFSGTERARKMLLPLLSLIASFAVLWNFDSGFVVYVSVFISLVYSSFSQQRANVIKLSVKYAVYMLISLIIAFGIFILSTYVRSGEFPHLSKLLEFQEIFYIYGYFMLPMEHVHFWQIPAMVYIASCFYCIFSARTQDHQRTPAIAFLFLLGCGLFAYFQGRSYSTNVALVLYPAIIILGIFSEILLEYIAGRPFRLSAALLLFIISFTVLADGTLSLIQQAPDIQSFTFNNFFPEKLFGKKRFDESQEFVNANFRRKDTVIIFSRNYESFYYAAGIYYNPVNVPSSTEMIYKREFDSLISAIEKRKYAVLFDSMLCVEGSKAIMKSLHENAYVSKRNSTGNLIIFRPKKQKYTP